MLCAIASGGAPVSQSCNNIITDLWLVCDQLNHKIHRTLTKLLHTTMDYRDCKVNRSWKATSFYHVSPISFCSHLCLSFKEHGCVSVISQLTTHMDLHKPQIYCLRCGLPMPMIMKKNFWFDHLHHVCFFSGDMQGSALI